MGRDSMQSHYYVFNYWKDKCITSDGEVKIDYGYPGCTLKDEDVNTTIGVVVDWGEPMCWCCGCPVTSDYDKLDEKILESDETLEDRDDAFLRKLWSHKDVTSILQRAHIVPSALKGSGQAENLFLLCPTCHLESPDALDPKFFLRYIYDERKNGAEKRYKEFKDYLDRIGLYIYYPDESIKTSKTIGTHSATFVRSSKMALGVMKYIKGYENLCDMTVKDVKENTDLLSWVEGNEDKKAKPYINIENKLFQLVSAPKVNDVSVEEFSNIISHSNNYEIAEMISDRYNVTRF